MGDTAASQHARDVIGLVTGIGKGIGKPQIASVEEPVRTSWVRCVEDYRLDPVRMHAPLVVDSGDIRDKQSRHDELIDIARAEMDALYEQISGSGYALLLTDIDGIILCEKVDPTLSKMFRSAGLLVGADWSEQSEGTNGIGTCIAEGRPVTIHRADHFRARHIGLSCTGAPIRDTNGQMLAVLDASSVGAHDTRTSQMHTRALVNTSARLIEKCLFLRRCQNYRVLRFHGRPEFVNLLHDAAIAYTDDGTIVGVDQMAAALLNAPGREELVGHKINEVFDIAESDLERQAMLTGHSLFTLRDLRQARRYFAVVHAPQNIVNTYYPRAGAAGRQSAEVVRIVANEPNRALQLDDLAGTDPAMLRNVRCARRVVDSAVPILIQGPTGSGKEAFAKALHECSQRAGKAFVAVNCAAIPETLIESELFGYKAGAFTGARKEGMRGRIVQSSGGTLFLDEIGDMPLPLQTRLLRVLEEQEVTPLGCETSTKVDLRVISASHRNLRSMIEQGSFREDLYYRLNGITLELPSLAERSDKERLIRRFIATETTPGRPIAIDAEAFDRLLTHTWPGNIRELRNVVRTALAISEGGIVRVADLPREIREASERLVMAPGAAAVASGASLDPSPGPTNPLEAAERQAILAAVETSRWNMTLTAQQLGMSRNTLYRKLKRHGIPVGESRRDELSRQ